MRFYCYKIYNRRDNLTDYNLLFINYNVVILILFGIQYYITRRYISLLKLFIYLYNIVKYVFKTILFTRYLLGVIRYLNLII